jgi:hypothetical protein
LIWDISYIKQSGRSITRFKVPAVKPFTKPLLLRLSRHHPPCTINDIALMLELDLALGNKQDFERRLRKAITEAFKAGQRAKT